MVSMRIPLLAAFCIAVCLPAAGSAGGGPIIDLEGGGVLTGYNDVRIPGTTGTLFSLVDDLETDPSLYFRVRISYILSERHTVSLLAAPLRLDADGTSDRTILYEGETFEAGEPLDALYRFDSYRLTYRYEFYRSSRLQAGVGITAKIRDASIRVESGSLSAEKKNTGFVPLLNFNMTWSISSAFGLLLEGDALAAPQGRAEDVQLALFYEPARRVTVRLGYRVLEGGADNDEVYSFAMLHYMVLGASFEF